MTAMTNIHARARQAGMTLIELLISITIGLFIIGAALMVFQSTSGVGGQVTELTQLRQQGMHAFRAIGKQIREAGSVQPLFTENNNFRFGTPDADGVTGPYVWIGGTPINSYTAPSGSTAGAGTLGMSQQPVPTTSGYKDLLRNCLGQAVNATGTNARSNFYLKPVSGKSYNELMCETGSNANGQPIVSNVHAFTVRYRVRPSAANVTTKQFVNTPTNWSLVDAVEVCLDLVGDRATPTSAGTDANYTNCEGNSVTRGNRLHVVQRNLFTVFSAQR